MSTTPVNPVESTGEFVMSWGPDGPTITAPAKVVIPAMDLFSLDRVPGEPGVVELPGGVRYLIGNRRRPWSDRIYLHKLH